MEGRSQQGNFAMISGFQCTHFLLYQRSSETEIKPFVVAAAGLLARRACGFTKGRRGQAGRVIMKYSGLVISFSFFFFQQSSLQIPLREHDD